jgi:hypothetical protein
MRRRALADSGKRDQDKIIIASFVYKLYAGWSSLAIRRRRMKAL